MDLPVQKILLLLKNNNSDSKTTFIICRKFLDDLGKMFLRTERVLRQTSLGRKTISEEIQVEIVGRPSIFHLNRC